MRCILGTPLCTSAVASGAAKRSRDAFWSALSVSFLEGAKENFRKSSSSRRAHFTATATLSLIQGNRPSRAQPWKSPRCTGAR